MGRKRVRGLIQVAVSVILLGLILRQVHWAEVRDTLAHIDVRWLGVAWGLFLLGVVVRAARWQVLLEALEVHRPLGELVAWYFVGGFFNVILPTGFGGDAVRVIELAQDTDRPGSTILSSVLVDRYAGIMVLLAMGLVAGLAQPGAAPASVLGLTAGLFIGGLLVAWFLRRPWWSRWGSAATAQDQQRGDRWGRWARRLHLPALTAAVASYNLRSFGLALAISLAFNLLQIGWNVALARGLGLHVPLIHFLVFVPLISAALLLPAFGGLGVRELSYVGLFGSVGVPQAGALALSLAVYIITVAGGLVGGVIYLIGGVRRAGHGATR